MSELINHTAYNALMHAPFLAVPGLPRNVKAAEVSERVENICIILLTWNSPANTDQSDVDQYIVNVTSRNIPADTVSSTIKSLRVPDCGNDIRIQVAAVSRFGCEGPNVEVQPSLLDNIPTAHAPSENGTTSTAIQGGQSPTLSKYAVA